MLEYFGQIKGLTINFNFKKQSFVGFYGEMDAKTGVVSRLGVLSDKCTLEQWKKIKANDTSDELIKDPLHIDKNDTATFDTTNTT